MQRRSLILFATAAATASLSQAQVNTFQERPDPANFQSGDFVWPKPSGAFVPYAGLPPDRSLVQAEELSEEVWTAQRIEFVRSARLNPPQDPIERAYVQKLADDLENVSYTAFFHSYAADVAPSDFQAMGAGQLLYVDHMAIIDVDERGEPHVIEAVYGKAPRGTSLVERLPYTEWLIGRKTPLVWHGRLRGADRIGRQAIAVAAREQINKPYRFFNFDLSDASGFYCSKLAWYATMKATGIALDGKSDPKRFIWFSPLQALKRKSEIEILSSAGNYRNA
jgi:hypothetical protein